MITPLLSAMGPLILWPIELVLPYPYIVEEVFKGIIIYMILGVAVRRTREKLVILSAVLFSLSESVMYLFNIALVGNTDTFLLRLLLTIGMHLSTFLIIYLLAETNRKLLPFGVFAGFGIHFLYNFLIPFFFS